MRTPHLKLWLTTAGAVVLLAVLAACTPGVPHIRDLKIGKDKEVNSESKSFGAREKIFAVAHISSVSEKMTIKWQVIAIKAGGQENFRVPNLETSFDLDSDNDATFYMEPPDAGWPTGQYQIELRLLTNSGEKKDEKTADFTVTGG